MRSGVIQILQPAVLAPADGELQPAALRAPARRVGILNLPRQAALAADNTVGVVAGAGTIGAAITQVSSPDGAVDQQPQRNWPGPLVRG